MTRSSIPSRRKGGHSKPFRRKARRGQSKVKRDEELRIRQDCPECGKKRYISRRAARKVLHTLKGSDSMSVYRCVGDFFHIGHTPYAIRNGWEARD